MAVNSQYDVTRLLNACKRGDQQAWSRLVEQFSNLVYSVPTRMKLNSDDCADVFQATFLALSKSLDRIEHAVALPKWLAVTASREALRLLRANARSGGESSFDELDLDTLIANDDESVEDSTARAMDVEAIRKGLGHLPKNCRDLLELMFRDEEPSYQEISDKLGIPVGAIGPTRSRCLQKLRRILAQRGFFDEQMYSEQSEEAPKHK
ncbi:MAG: sigma-70 family RNA polymerase sigma factor [Fimbriimonadales bacterium]